MEGELLTATGCGDIATVKKLVNVNDGVNLEATDWVGCRDLNIIV